MKVLVALICNSLGVCGVSVWARRGDEGVAGFSGNPHLAHSMP